MHTDAICYRMAGLWQSWTSMVGVCPRLHNDISDASTPHKHSTHTHTHNTHIHSTHSHTYTHTTHTHTHTHPMVSLFHENKLSVSNVCHSLVVFIGAEVLFVPLYRTIVVHKAIKAQRFFFLSLLNINVEYTSLSLDMDVTYISLSCFYSRSWENFNFVSFK